MVQIKKYSHEAIVFNYFFAEGKERETYNEGANIYFTGNTLYSYGRHFPLATKCKNGHILNGDYYSVTTTNHQALTRRLAELYYVVQQHKEELKDAIEKTIELKNTSPIYNALLRIHSAGVLCERCMKERKFAIVPFTALEAAGIQPDKVEIIDVRQDEWVPVKDSKTGEIHYRHILGASLIKYRGHYYLSSTETLSKNQYRRPYFLVKLKHKPKTVEEAFRLLADGLSDEQYKDLQLWENKVRHWTHKMEFIIEQNKHVKRQGEYFLIPTRKTTKELLSQSMPIPLEKICNRIRFIHLLVDDKYSILEATPEIESRIEDLKNPNYVSYVNEDQLCVIKQGNRKFYLIADLRFKPKKIIVRKQRNGIYRGYAIGKVKHVNLSDRGNPHIATEAILTKEGLYIRGTLRHPEHKTIYMQNVWHKVVRNSALQSWTARGRID